MQSKKDSLIESITNVSIGYVVAILTQIVVFPLFDINTSWYENLGIAACFTVVSVIRSYVVRRFFTNRTEVVNESI